MSLALAGWSTTPSRPAAHVGKKYTIDFIFTGYMYPYFAPMAQAVKQAAAYYPNLSIKIIAANNSGSEESSEIDEAVASGVNGIILNPVDGAVTSAAQQAMNDHIPVITIDRDVDSKSARIAFIGDNDVKLGEIQTQYALKYLAAKHIRTPWKVVILQGTLGSSTAIDRLRGEMNALRPYIRDHKVQLVLNQSANFATNTAEQVMSEFLAKDPHINLVLAGNDAMALGAITAIQDQHLPLGKTVFVAGADAQPQDLEDIIHGTQLDDVTHAPFVEAYWAVEAMANYLEYHITPPTHFKNGDVVIPMTLVTKANVSQIHAWGTPNVIPPLPYGKSSAHRVHL
ncbi:MAG: sugar ABC transporter substrate-binding protein [Sulfobacillus acidophilus]|uniref:Sugar ABC transporter substrate-binding protein n=1 Tax=Sulfobacillus acidophilus TaxID=53633 RepID=A0A2T2WDD1_9FIRM|nr:MAG: sugar ABC transporter substrate-binding protein [Sulfobacillus acidophilus]